MSPRQGAPPALAQGTPEFLAAYDQLRALAAGYVRRLQPHGVLQATALVHEAYLKLAKQTQQFNDASHLVCVTAMAMRQVLLDQARAGQRKKRGGELLHITLTGEEPCPGPGVDVLALDDALQRLSEMDPRQAQTVELRFFIAPQFQSAARRIFQ